jgi:hypothetical protein
MMASKKGMSALQISRMIGLSYKTTWFLCHRIRNSLRGSNTLPPIGGDNKVVEADETYVGGKAKNRAFKEPAKKKAVLSLVEREGHVRSFHIANATATTLRPIIAKNVQLASMLMTYESAVYPSIGKNFANHGTVNHSANEYARLGGFVHINTAVIMIGDVIAQTVQQGDIPFFAPLEQSLIPTDSELKKLAPLEPVLTVGYPGQLWDDLNNLPLFHRGSTSTAPYIDFKGKKEFLVDFATWPGASGSPVFIFNEGSFFDSRTGNLMLGRSRILLIGVVYGVAVQEITGDVVIQQAPTMFGATSFKAATNVPTNLGACLRASHILEMEPLLSRFGVTAPPGYIPRNVP